MVWKMAILPEFVFIHVEKRLVNMNLNYSSMLADALRWPSRIIGRFNTCPAL